MPALLDEEEVKVLLSFAGGETIEQTAIRLHRSPDWVKQRRAELRRRVRATTLTEALVIYAERGAFTNGG